MSWSYSGDPSSNNLDAVRFLIGDTDSSSPQIQDEEINWLLSTYTNVHLTAAKAAETLAAKYARLVDKSVGDLSLSYSQRQDSYRKLAQQLKLDAALTSGSTLATPYAGGISVSDKAAQESDTDRVKPAFRVGMHTNFGSAGSGEEEL